MNVEQLLQWFNENRELITVLDAERECEIPKGTLSAAIAGTRNLPKKYIEPLTVLKDSLDNGTPLKELPKQEEPKQITAPAPPMLKSSNREFVQRSTNLSNDTEGQPRKYPTYREKHGAEFVQVSERTIKTPSGQPHKIRNWFNGSCYKQTGNFTPARYSFNLSDLK